MSNPKSAGTQRSPLRDRVPRGAKNHRAVAQQMQGAFPDGPLSQVQNLIHQCRIRTLM